MEKIFIKLQNNKILSNIRAGMVNAIPVLLAGSMALIISSFIDTLGASGGFAKALKMIADIIYESTFGILSLVMTVTISSRWLQEKKRDTNFFVGIFAALISFLILNGGLNASVNSGSIGVKGMFVAILASVASTSLFSCISVFMRRIKLISIGGGLEFQNVLNSVIPFLCTVLCFSFINGIVCLCTGLANFNELFIWIIDNTVANMAVNLFSAIIFIILVGVFWFFGIHGSNVLEPMVDKLFTPAIHINEALAAAGQAPTEIFSKTFFDVFVLMGGCGTTMALLAAILIFSKNKRNRKTAVVSSAAMLFNVNEIMVFGLPIVLNPIMLIPFIFTPVLCVFTSYLAMKTGLVPMPVNEVQWSTPIFVSGYAATKSVAGIILQAVNLIIGIAFYRPFVIMCDKSYKNIAASQLNRVVEFVKEGERLGRPVALLGRNDDIGYASRYLEMDIIQSMDMGKLKIFYQPQYNSKDECIGAEALLRYRTEDYGIIYPPLVIQLAREGGNLSKLEKYVFKEVLWDLDDICRAVGKKVKISVNVTPDTLLEESFHNFLRGYSLLYDKSKVEICIEVTEQTHLDITPKVEKIFALLHSLGYTLAIDDFSMGSTSIKYLKKDYFDEVKLDGGLVKNINGEGNEREIISSVISLAKSLNIGVVAEYTESREIQRELEKLGCNVFQGYLYSPAVKAEDFANALADCEVKLKGMLK